MRKIKREKSISHNEGGSMAPIPQTHPQTQDCEKCFGGPTSFPSFVSFFDKNRLDAYQE